jgi:predicted dehydrogenase
MKGHGSITRRSFFESTGKGAAALAATVGAPAILGAKGPNETIGVGHIGLGVRGGELIQQTAGGTAKNKGIAGAKVVAVCDLYKPHLQKGIERSQNPSVRSYTEYEKLLADPDVDVVVAAVPDHWHSRILIDAANAKKDVYIEKCWTRTVPEAKAMLKAVKDNKIVMQLGHQGRESVPGTQARELLKTGILGPITFVRIGTFRNRERGKDEWRWFGGYSQYDRPDPAQVAKDVVDWKRWLGAAQARPFDFERFWHWRCYWDYGTGIAGDLLSHEFDFVQYVLGYGIPDTCVCSGQIGLLKDGRECPDIWNTIYEYLDKGTTLSYACTFNSRSFDQMPEFRGKDACLKFSEGHASFDVFAEEPSKKYAPRFQSGKITPEKPLLVSFDKTKTPEQPSHMQDFFNCVRSRQKPKCNEDEAFVEAVTCILSVEAFKQGRRVKWDREKQEIV